MDKREFDRKMDEFEDNVDKLVSDGVNLANPRRTEIEKTGDVIKFSLRLLKTIIDLAEED